MKSIWAGWRMKYILGEKGHHCVFCEALKSRDDVDHLVLFRGKKAALMLNLYPYTSGHLLVVPYAHVGDLTDLDSETQAEMMQLTSVGLRALRLAMKPHGFNVGANLGEAAGAGIRDHVHMHIVPRWENDTNFMPVLGDVRVIPEWLEDTYRKLRSALDQLEGEVQRLP